MRRARATLNRTDRPRPSIMDGLDGAIRRALAGDDRGRQILEHAMAEELGESTSVHDAVARRLRAIGDIRAIMKRETMSQGDNVKPLAELNLNDATVWVLLRVADRIMAQFRTLRKAGKKEALVVGIVGSVGSGKHSRSGNEADTRF